VGSLLGLANYCGKHIPNLATLAEPLWSLVDKNKQFEWNDVHEKALKSIKDRIVKNALSFFNKDWDTELTVDASPVGLGAVLAQVNPADSNDRKIICFQSRLLSDVERRSRESKNGSFNAL
jgi:hypothetical protein